MLAMHAEIISRNVLFYRVSVGKKRFSLFLYQYFVLEAKSCQAGNTCKILPRV